MEVYTYTTLKNIPTLLPLFLMEDKLHPILIEIFGIKIYTYGFFVALAILLSTSFIQHQLSKSISEEVVNRLIFKAILYGFIGAKVVNILEHWKEYYRYLSSLDPKTIVGLLTSGYSFWGVLAGIGIYIYLFCKKSKGNNIDCNTLLDIIATGTLLGLSIGKLGCLSAGCCYGKVCHYWFAIKFTNPLSAAPLNVPLWPVQLIESIGYFVLFLSSYLLRKIGIHTFGFSLASYCLFRFLIEFIRATTPIIFTIHNLSITWIQIACLLLLPISIYILLKTNKKEN